MANPLSKEYIAGYVDGEGCIGLYKRPRGGFHPQIIVTNTYGLVLFQLKEMYGGSMYHADRPKPRKPIYKWSLGSKPVIEQFLHDILPFLQEKRPQALAMLDFLTGKLQGDAAWNELKWLKRSLTR